MKICACPPERWTPKGEDPEAHYRALLKFYKQHYGNLHKNLKWARQSTIGHGAPCCDFRIIDVSRRPDYDG